MKTTPRNPARSQCGFSLVEGIIAAALVLVVAVAVLPIFVRALDSNLSGSRRSQLSNFVSGGLEELNQGPIDRDEWSVEGVPGGVLAAGPGLGSSFWDAGADYEPDRLGDEKWVATEASAAGLVLFERNADLRKYSLSDIQIVIGAGGGVTTGGGDPLLFDNPLTTDDAAHLTEMRVSIKENREALPVASGKRITVSHFRAF